MVKGTAEIGVRASAGGSFIAKSAIVDLNKRAHISAPQRTGIFIGRVVLMHAAGKLNRVNLIGGKANTSRPARAAF